MIGVIHDAEAGCDQLRDARGRPEVGGIARLERAREERVDESSLLRGGEFRGAPRGRVHNEPRIAFRRDGIAPAHHRTRRTPEPPGDFIQRHVLLQHRERAAPARFEDRSSTGGAHAVILARMTRNLCHYLCRRQ